MVSGNSWRPLGRPLGLLWGPLVLLGAPLGSLPASLGDPWGSFGGLGGSLGVPWGLLWSPAGICRAPEWIWDAFGVVLGGILGSKTYVLGNKFDEFWKTLDFRNIARRAGERLFSEVQGGKIGALGD